MTPIRPRLAGRARLRTDRLTGETILLAPERGLALNRAAATVVGLCDGARTLEAIVACLVDEFPRTAAAEIERDVRALVARLAERGLLEDAR